MGSDDESSIFITVNDIGKLKETIQKYEKIKKTSSKGKDSKSAA